MKKYIFLTNEWFAQHSNWSDIENVQMVWISEGNNPDDAFENLIKEKLWLEQTSFEEIFCY